MIRVDHIIIKKELANFNLQMLGEGVGPRSLRMGARFIGYSL
jgi:hypothetical protein